MHRLRATWALLALGLLACGSPPGIGAECELDEDCADGDYCELSIDHGYCTRARDEDDDCSASACAELLPGTQLCTRLCIDTADCHVDRDDDPEDYDLFCIPAQGSGVVLSDPDRAGKLCLP